MHEVPSGESHKSLQTAEQLWKKLNDAGADRKSCLVILGGGVLTDLGGFVAATFRRGMPFVSIPTSLLAMVDAAIGGKTGVNLGSMKNHVGVFALPDAIFIDPKFLQTLPPQELKSGFAEILKHGLIANKDYWEDAIQIDEIAPEFVAPLIAESVRLKESIVAQDPTEKGIRKALNFGHTVGHALESIRLNSSAPLMHGEAVALGMIAEVLISEKRELITKEASLKCVEGIRRSFPSLRVLSTPKDWWPYMLQDKKNEGQTVLGTLLSSIGQAEINVPILFEDLDGLEVAINASAR